MTAWTAIVGASKYAAAVASGDIADEEAQRLRIARCRTCPTMRAFRVPLVGGYSGWCGTPFKERGGPEPACGCLVAFCGAVPDDGEDAALVRLRVLAALQPAGKACVGSQACPQGKWGADPPCPDGG